MLKFLDFRCWILRRKFAECSIWKCLFCCKEPCLFFFFRELNTSHSSEDQHDWAADKPEGESQQATESADIKYIRYNLYILYDHLCPQMFGKN
jgi:hypothetical protein